MDVSQINTLYNIFSTQQLTTKKILVFHSNPNTSPRNAFLPIEKIGVATLQTWPNRCFLFNLFFRGEGPKKFGWISPTFCASVAADAASVSNVAMTFEAMPGSDGIHQGI